MCAVKQSPPLDSPPSGYSARPATEDDFDQIYKLIHDYDVSIVGYSDFAMDDLRELFHEEHFNPARHTRLVIGDGHRGVGYAMLWGREPHQRYASFAVVHPDHLGRGIGTHLLSFLEHRMPDEAVDKSGAVLWNWVDLEDDAAQRMVEAAGFKEVRRHYTMLVDVADSDPNTEDPEGIHIRSCTEEDTEVIHGLLEETFADHWGFTPISYETWRKQSFERTDTHLDMWFLASEGDEPAGFLVGRPMEDMGWVADLGVRKRWRKRGIGSALLRRSFADFKRRGFEKIGLGVDASNETGAVRVYEQVGMTPSRVYLTYEKRYRRRL
jgi:mycothiol synthase